MDASFDIQPDAAHRLVRIRLSGFFTPQTLAAFVVARNAAFERLRCPANRHLVLIDLRPIQIQSQETVAAFRTLLADPATQARRLAFVIAGTLARHQLMRALDGRDARCFTDPAEAERWLLDSDDASRAAA